MEDAIVGAIPFLLGFVVTFVLCTWAFNRSDRG